MTYADTIGTAILATSFALAIGGLAWAIHNTGKALSKATINRIDDQPEPEPEPEPVTDRPDIIGAPRIRWYSLATPADIDAILADPTAPPDIRTYAARYAHARGWCGCTSYDQDAVLTQDDLDWLRTQGGAS